MTVTPVGEARMAGNSQAWRRRSRRSNIRSETAPYRRPSTSDKGSYHILRRLASRAALSDFQRKVTNLEHLKKFCPARNSLAASTLCALRPPSAPTWASPLKARSGGFFFARLPPNPGPRPVRRAPPAVGPPFPRLVPTGTRLRLAPGCFQLLRAKPG